MLVEFHIIVSHKMVSLFAGTGRRFSVSVLEPSEHGLADVNSAVVHNVCLDDFRTVGLGYLRYGPAQQIIADVSEMQRLVCVGRRILHHDEWRLFRNGHKAITLVCIDFSEQFHPFGRSYDEVQKSLDHVEIGHKACFFQISTDFGGCFLGFLFGNAEQGEHHQGEVAFKLLFCFLELDLCFGHFLSVKFQECRSNGGCELVFYFHTVFVSF